MSTKTSLLQANKNKLDEMSRFIAEFRVVTQKIINIIWGQVDIKSLMPKEITDQIDSWISARAIQCAGKQASGIVRGTRAKQERRLYEISKMIERKEFKKARKLRAIYDEQKTSRPDLKQMNPELDERFVAVDLDNKTTFDGWLTLGSLGDRLKLVLPFRKHKHFNKMLGKGKMTKGVRISEDEATFMFDIEDAEPIEVGETLGIDIGFKTILSCSSGQLIDTDIHGHNYESICRKLARKKKDSYAFKRAVRHRTNYINHSVNKINLRGIKQVNREEIKHLRRGKSGSKIMGHWNYAELFDRIDAKIIQAGVQLNKVCPTYTSQRCNNCGYVRSGNRIKKKFKCLSCSHEQDADLNASKNLSTTLPAISRKQRLKRLNRNGFYWHAIVESL